MVKKRETLEEQYARIKSTSDKKLAQLQAKMKAQEARAKEKERKDRDSRNYILGALLATHISRNPDSDIARLFTRLIDEYVITSSRRKLFALPPLPEAEQKARRARHRRERRQHGETDQTF